MPETNYPMHVAAANAPDGHSTVYSSTRCALVRLGLQRRDLSQLSYMNAILLTRA